MSDSHYESAGYLPALQQDEDDGQGGPSRVDVGGGKRKRDDNSGTQRAKRNRYITIACNECKRRKIKCNGETPCQRCGNLKLDCVYEPNCCSGNLKQNGDFKQLTAHVEHLEGQIQYLLQNLNHLRGSIGQEDFPDVAQYQQAQLGQQQQQQQQQQGDVLSSLGAPQANMAIDPTLQTRPSRHSPQQSRFHGPASSAFSLGVAQHSLKHMGLSSAEEAIDAGVLSQVGHQDSNNNTATKRTIHSSKDPIWAVTKEEALRLCRVFEDENGLLYPFLDIDQLMRHASMLYQFMEAANKNFALSILPGADTLQDEDTDALKLVLAIALVTENGGESDLGKRLFDQVNRGADSRLSGHITIKDIQILTLTAIYHFHSDDEGLAWRVIGLAARLCHELGLHRADTYIREFKTERERSAAMKLFWSVYVLDHRWSMGTGMSFAIQDADIDKNLPTPEDTSPYLATMIPFARIGRQIWTAISSPGLSNANDDTIPKEQATYLNRQIVDWYSKIPQQLHYMHLESSGHNGQSADSINQAGGRALYRLRVLLYLRKNHMRLAIYRPTLHSTACIAADVTSARTAVDVAKDTIRVLQHIDQTSDIYRTQQTTWNDLLLAALAALALAICHAPDRFSELCRDEFRAALDLIRGLSGNSYVSKRLWRTIRSLRELGPSLGYNTRSGMEGQDAIRQDQPQNDAQRSAAAMAMAGLATGQPVDETAFFANNALNGMELNHDITRNDRSGHAFTNPNGMANELTNLFEAAGVLGGIGSGSGNWGHNWAGDSGNGVDQGQVQGGLDARLPANDNEELGRILRELF